MNTEEEYLPPPSISFEGIPFPELSFLGSKADIVGVQIASSFASRKRIVRIRFTDIKSRKPGTYELVGTQQQMESFARFLSQELPSAITHAKSPYCLATELPDGNLLLCLTDNGTKQLEAERQVDTLLQGSTGTDINMTSNRVHPTLLPPFAVTEDGRLWYAKATQRKPAGTFVDEWLERIRGWIVMNQYKK
jgi:hypothetical protein